MKAWTLSEAQVRLGDVVREAQRDGPQFVVREGREVAVVLSADEYRELEAPGFLLNGLGQAHSARREGREGEERQVRGGSLAPSPDAGPLRE